MRLPCEIRILIQLASSRVNETMYPASSQSGRACRDPPRLRALQGSILRKPKGCIGRIEGLGPGGQGTESENGRRKPKTAMPGRNRRRAVFRIRARIRVRIWIWIRISTFILLDVRRRIPNSTDTGATTSRFLDLRVLDHGLLKKVPMPGQRPYKRSTPVTTKAFPIVPGLRHDYR